MNPKLLKKLSPQARKYVLRSKAQKDIRAVVRFALSSPDQITAILKDADIQLSNWISKEMLTAVLELSEADLEKLIEMDCVTYVDFGGALSVPVILPDVTS